LNDISQILIACAKIQDGHQTWNQKFEHNIYNFCSWAF